MCINTTPAVGREIDGFFHESPSVARLAEKNGYTSTSTWLKMAVLHLKQTNPSGEKLAKLYESCKTDSVFLSVLTGETIIAK